MLCVAGASQKEWQACWRGKTAEEQAEAEDAQAALGLPKQERKAAYRTNYTPNRLRHVVWPGATRKLKAEAWHVDEETDANTVAGGNRVRVIHQESCESGEGSAPASGDDQVRRRQTDERLV